MSDVLRNEPGPRSSDGTLGQGLSDRRVLGKGEFPVELDGLNWTAYFFPWLWSAFYGVWWPYLIFAVGYLVGPGLRLVLPDVFMTWVTYSYLRAGWAVVMCGFLLWYGVNANKLAWRAAKRRGAGVLTRTVDGLGYGQRLVFLIGVILVIVGWGAVLASALRSPENVLAIRGSAFVMLGANLISIGVAVYLSKAAHGRLWRMLALRES